jgi:hypothetical protein
MSAVAGFCMRLANPAVAATQFTAYMALHNLPYSYSSAWQGASVTAYGYTSTLQIDAALALTGLAILYWVVPKRAPQSAPNANLNVSPFAAQA